ncbi:hypothetical protein LTR66_011258 [Elasticomyces elasticus]|nr:hypothetical protein LTR66_011258 [Elasticomyces elasticus]
MFSTIILSTAFMASAALAQSIGRAIVVNKCSYPVHLCNTPAANGGFSQIDKILPFDGTYEQTWTELTNKNGWSIKLSNSTDYSKNIMQYEYTFHNDGIIWYDVSEVDGNPWNKNWEITSATSTCKPKQQAYRYATDDAYGMQACPSDAVITVTLCSAETANDGAAASASSSVAAQSSTKAASSTAAASTRAASSTSVSVAPTSTSVSAAPTSSTTAAAVSSSNVATTSTTQGSTSTSSAWWRTHTWGASKRDEHLEAHAHAARHPHARR